MEFQRLLRMLWRPWNFYCIHVDSDVDPAIMQYIERLIQCFTNVYLPTRR